VPQQFEELHYYVRPIQTIDQAEIDKKWRYKLRLLQEEYIALELELYRRRNTTSNEVLVEDHEKVRASHK
jgi:hypothetical protein